MYLLHGVVMDNIAQISANKTLTFQGIANAYEPDAMFRDGLGIDTKYVSVLQKKYDERRRSRFRLLKAIQGFLGMNGHRFRVMECMHRVGAEFHVKRNGNGHAYYSGVHVCGSVWLCPVCSNKIASFRRAEFQQASEKGYSAMLITFTMQHGKGEALNNLLSVLNESVRSLKGGRWWQSFRREWNVKAYATSLEITYSQMNGWHPHKHMVIYCDIPQGDLDAEKVKAEILKRYSQLMKKNKRFVSGTYGIDVSVADDAVGNYVSKWGIWNEMSQAPMKLGRGESMTPFELAEAAAAGSPFAVQAFQEYAEATYGKRQIVWSHGARELFGLGAERSDADIAQGDLGDETIISLHGSWWHVIQAHDAMAEVLEVAERAGANGVMEFLNTLSPPW